jgi:hypothetical protein
VAATPNRWVLIDETGGATCADGVSKITADVLAHIAEAAMLQANGEFADEWGGAITCRIASSPTDIQEGEWVCSFVATFPRESDAGAFHEISANGIPDAFVAVSTCFDFYGPNGCSVDFTHEALETQENEGCNKTADDNVGTLHMHEVCDAVETQTYKKTCADGTEVHVTNWVTRQFFVPGASGPYDYMSRAGIQDQKPPPGPMQTAPSANGQGNYQIEEPSSQASETQVFADVVPGKPDKSGPKPALGGRRIVGNPRKPEKVTHWSSRSSKCGVDHSATIPANQRAIAG